MPSTIWLTQGEITGFYTMQSIGTLVSSCIVYNKIIFHIKLKEFSRKYLTINLVYINADTFKFKSYFARKNWVNWWYLRFVF